MNNKRIVYNYIGILYEWVEKHHNILVISEIHKINRHKKESEFYAEWRTRAQIYSILKRKLTKTYIMFCENVFLLATGKSIL